SRRILESFVSQKIEKMLNNKSYSNIRGGIVMKQITDEELRAIRERAEKATAGEWQIADTTDGVWLIDEDDLIIAGTFERIEDAVFSKHARQDIPKLLAEIDRLSRLYCELKEIAHNIEVDRNETAAEYREYYEKSEAEIDRLKEML